MDTYKLEPKSTKIKNISKETFEKDTGKLKPYYQEGKDSQYAVCPVCDNPISIIGLYNPKAKTKPYGKHYPRDVENLAVYDSHKYETCPYASRVWEDKRKRVKSSIDGTAKEIIEFMQENFDSVIRLLRQITGIVFSDKMIEKMIQHFLSAKGYAYYNAYVMNSAWIFGYMQVRVGFYGMIIDNSHPIYNALISHPCVKIENNRIVSNNGYIKPEFYFMLHRIQQKDNIKSEYINYYIDIDEKNIFNQEIKIDLPLFSKILNRKTAKTKNDIHYIDMFRNACKQYLTL